MAWKRLEVGACLAGLLILFGCRQNVQETRPPSVATPETRAPSADTEGVAQIREMEIVARDFRFEPAEITASPGQEVWLVLRNQGQSPHNIEIDLPDGDVELPENVAPGSQGLLTFTVPDQPGRYHFDCPVDDHDDRGMRGVLIVR